MKTYARWLFGIAGVFNLVVGGALLFARPWLIAILRLDPAGGSNLVLANLAGMFVALFGYAYLRIAADPLKYRLYIHLGAAGKLLAVICVIPPWLTGAIPATLPVLVTADLVFALLFLDFLRRLAGLPA
jgi:hypothetical protein